MPLFGALPPLGPGLTSLFLQAIRSGLAEAQRVAGGSGSEEEKAEAVIEVQVYEALQAALKA